MSDSAYLDSVLGITPKQPTKAQDILVVSETKKTEVIEASKTATANVAEVSAIPKNKPSTLVVHDVNGNVVGSGSSGDGDAQASNRMAYDSTNPDHAGKAYDAWEQDHNGWNYNAKKMTKQRQALADLHGMDVKDITDQDVYAMGDYAAKKLEEARRSEQSQDGSSDALHVTMNKLLEGKDKTGSTRKLVSETGVTSGKNMLDIMNTPELNADYYSKYNWKKREDDTHGSTVVEQGKVQSDREASGGIVGEVYNTLVGANDNVRSLVAKTANFVEDTTTAITNPVLQNMPSYELDMVDSISKTRDVARGNAEAETAIKAARAAYLREHPKDIEGANNKFKSTGFSTNIDDNIKYTQDQQEYLKSGKIIVRDAEKELNGEKYTPTYYQSEMGTPENAIKLVNDNNEHRKSVLEDVKSVTDLVAKDSYKVSKVGGKESLVATVSASDFLKKQADKDIEPEVREAAKEWDKGNYGSAILSVSKGGAKYAVNNPAATIQVIAESLPEMMFNVFTGGTGLTIQSNASYNTQLDNFKKQQGRNPTESESQVMIALGMAKSLSDKGADSFILDGVPTLAGKKLVEFAASKGIKVGNTTKFLTGVGLGASTEGLQEGTTQYMEAYGANQNSGKNINMEPIFRAASVGFASGGVMTGGMSAPTGIAGVAENTISAVSTGIKTVPKVLDAVWTGMNTVMGTKFSTNNSPENKNKASHNPDSIAAGIASVESGKAGYNAYNTGTVGQGKEKVDFSKMTIAQIQDRQSLPKGNSNRLFAVGMYQVIPETMQAAIDTLGLDPNTKFTPEVQERIFTDYLVKQKRPPMYKFIIGKSNDLDGAQLAMAQEWASVAKDGSGKSYYAGDSAGNAAHMTDKQAEAFLQGARATYKANLGVGMSPDEAYRSAMYAKNDKVIFDNTSSESTSSSFTPVKISTGSPITFDDATDNMVEPTIDLDSIGSTTTEEVKDIPVFQQPKSVSEVTSNVAKQTELEMKLAGKTAEDIATDPELQQVQQEADGLAVLNAEEAPEPTMEELLAMMEAFDTASLASIAVSGNTDITKQDLSKLDERTRSMVTELSKYNVNLSTNMVDKNYEQVKAEVLGTVSVNDKLGLGSHLRAIAATATTGNKELTYQAVQRLQSFRRGMVAKSQAITDAIANNVSEVKLDNGFRFEIKNKGQAKGFLRNLNKEIETLGKGLRLGAEIYNSTFHKAEPSNIDTTTTAEPEVKGSISKVTKEDVALLVKDTKEKNVNNSGVKLEVREDTKDNEVSYESMRSGSLNTIMKNMKTSSNEMVATVQELVTKLSSKADVKVITAINGKEITRQFMHYGSNVIGLVMPNKGGAKQKGTSNTTVLHEALHAYLNDYLTNTKDSVGTKATLQKEYARVYKTYNEALKASNDVVFNKDNSVLEYATNPTELYAMYMNSKTVGMFMDSITDTGSIAKGFTLLDSFLKVVADILAKVFKKTSIKQVTLSQSLEAVIISSLKDIAGELQVENSAYIQALDNAGKVLPDNIYKMLMEDTNNLTKDGKVKSNILTQLGMDAKLRDELHDRLFTELGAKQRKPRAKKVKVVKPLVQETKEAVTEVEPEVEDVNTSDETFTDTQEKIEVSPVNVSATHPMNYDMPIGSHNVPNVDNTSTYDLIEAGLRTSTTRGWGTRLPKVGDVIKFYRAGKSGILVRVTEVNTVPKNPDTAWIKQWEDSERWNYSYTTRNKTLHGHQVKFELVQPVIQANKVNDAQVDSPVGTQEVVGSTDPLFNSAKELLKGLISTKVAMSSSTYDKLVELLKDKLNVTYNVAVGLLEAVTKSTNSVLKNLDLTFKVKDKDTIPLYENEVVTNIFNYQKGVVLKTRNDGKTDIPLAMDIKSMDDSMVLRSAEPTSIYSTVTNVDSSEGIDSIMDTLTEEEGDMYTALVMPFNSMFDRALTAVLPEWLTTKDGVVGLLRDKAVEQPLSLLVDAQNSMHHKGSRDKSMLHKNLVHAMGMASLKWLTDNGSKTAYNNDSTIARIKGYSDDSKVTPEDREVFQQSGVPATRVALGIGKEVLRMLNVKQNPNASSGVDALYDERLAQQIGDFALLAMHNMHDSKGNMQFIVDYTHVPITAFFVEDSPVVKNADATVPMIKLNVPLDKNTGRPMYTEEGLVMFPNAAKIFSRAKTKDFKTMYKKLVTMDGANNNLSLEPIKTVPTTYKNAYSLVPDILKDAVASFQRNKVVPSSNHTLKQKLSKTAWLKMHGWVSEEFIDKQHKGLVAGFTGKNQTLMQEWDKMEEHEQNMEIATGELDSKYTFGSTDKGFYIPYTVALNGRIMDTSKTISVQRSKMHRNAFVLASHITNVQTNNKEHQLAAIRSFIEPMGLKKFETMKPENMVGEFFKTVMDKNGVILDEVLSAGVEAIIASRENIDFDEDAIVRAVEQLGEHGHSLLALQGLASWSYAITYKKDTWVSDMYTEVDGKTNGVIALARQIGIDFAEGMNPEGLLAVLNAGGMFFEGQEQFNSLNDYMNSGKLDNYQNVGIKAATAITQLEKLGKPHAEEYKTSAFISLKEANDDIKILKKMIKDGDTSEKMYNALKVAKEVRDMHKAVVEELSARQAVQDIKDIMPNFIEVDKDTGKEKLSKNGRNAAKPYVMTGAYQAGEFGQTAGGFYESVLPAIYKDMMKAHAEGDMGYFKKLNNSIAASLESNRVEYTFKDIDGSKLDQVKEEFPPEVEATLLRSYQSSYGKAMVKGYENSLGSVVSSGKIMVKAMSIVAAINAHIMNKAVKQAAEGRSTPLNKQEKEVMYKHLLSQGVYIGLQAPASTGWNDSIITMKEDKEQLTKQEGGRVETRLKPTFTINGKSIDVIRSKKQGKPFNTHSINSALENRIISESAGVSPIVMGNIGIDAHTQAMVSKTQIDSEFVNVFDAQIWGILDAIENTPNTNEQWNNVNADWSMADAVMTRLNESLELLAQLPADVQKQIEMDLVFHDKFPLESESFSEFKSMFDKTHAQIMNSKSNIDNNLILIEQYSVENGAKKIDEKQRLADTVMSFNYEEEVNVVENMEAPTTEGVMKLFMQLGSIDGNHSARLQDILTRYSLPLIVNSGNYVFNFKENQDKQVLRNKLEIHVPNVLSNIMFGEQMTAQEMMVNETLYPVWKTAMSVSTSTLTSLVELHKQAKAKLKPEDIGQEMYDQMFGTTEGIIDFATMGITNPKFIEVLNTKLGNVQTNTSVTDKLITMLNKVMNFFNGKMIESNKNVPSKILEELALKMYSSKVSAYTTLWNKITDNRATRALDNIKGVESIEKYIDDNRGTGKLSSLLQVPMSVVSDVNADRTVAMLDSIGEGIKSNSLTNEMGKLWNEAKGATGVKRNFHKLLTRANEHVDNAAMKISVSVTNLLHEKFGDLTAREWKALTNTLLRTDVSVIGSSFDVKELFSSSTYLDKSIMDTIGKLKSSDKVWVNQQAKSLGHFMITNEVLIEDLLLNASNISKGIGRASNIGVTSTDVDTINVLKTLYAIKSTKVEDKHVVVRMFNEGKDTDVLIKLKQNVDVQTLSTVYGNDESQVQAGKIEDVHNDYMDYNIRKDTGNNVGYSVFHSLGNGYSVYTRKSGNNSKYSRGIISIAGNKTEGTFVKLAKGESKKGLIPVVKNGNIVGYRIVVPNNVKEKLGVSNKANTVVATMTGNRTRLDSGREYNKELIDIAAKDFKDNFLYPSEKGKFIAITKDSNNAQVAEFAKLMSKEFKEDIASKFPNGTIYLRKEMLDLIIGYRKFSAVNYVGEKFNLDNTAMDILKRAEDVYQVAVGEVKRRVVVLTPAVVTANFVSNMVISTLFGMNPVTVLKDQTEGLLAIRSYSAWDTELKSLEIEVVADSTVIPEKAARIKELKFLMSQSGVHRLVQEGMFSTIVEDLNPDMSDSLTNKFMSAARLNTNTENEGRFTDRADPRLQTVGAYLSLAPTTTLGREIQLATAYSDFIARYAMYKHLVAKGMSHDEASSEVMDIYVDYAPNTSKGVQYINDMGVFMYTKFLVRIQKVIMKLMRTNKKGIAALLMAEQIMGNIPEGTDASLAYGVGMGRMNNPSEIFDTVSEIPLLHLIKGFV